MEAYSDREQVGRGRMFGMGFQRKMRKFLGVIDMLVILMVVMVSEV